MSDMYGYIAIETLLNFCEKSVDHAVTPNDFMRMPRVRVPGRKPGRWIPKDDRRYHCSMYDGIAPKGYRWDYCPHCGNFNGGDDESN